MLDACLFQLFLPTTGNFFAELGLRSVNAAAGVKHVDCERDGVSWR